MEPKNRDVAPHIVKRADGTEWWEGRTWQNDDPQVGYVGHAPDRILWGSDFPHPDAFYTNFVDMLDENIESLSHADQERSRGLIAIDFVQAPQRRAGVPASHLCGRKETRPNASEG